MTLMVVTVSAILVISWGADVILHLLDEHAADCETESFSYSYRAHDADVQLRYQSICVRSAEPKIQEKDEADDTFTFRCNKSCCYVRATG